MESASNAATSSFQQCVQKGNTMSPNFQNINENTTANIQHLSAFTEIAIIGFLYTTPLLHCDKIIWTIAV